MFYLKKIGVGLLAGLGIGARLAMRLIALAAHQATSFSMEGTLIILLSGALLGLVAGPIFVTVQAYMPGARWQGGVFGLIVLGMLSLAIPPPRPCCRGCNRGGMRVGCKQECSVYVLQRPCQPNKARPLKQIHAKTHR
jgi:hypothetical protein